MQHWKEPRGFSHLPAELSSPSVCRFYFWGREALGGHQDRPQVSLQVQFLRDTLRGVRKCLEHLQPLGEVGNRLHVRRALNGSLPRLLPVRDRLRDQPRLGVMMCQQLRLILFRV